MASNAITWIGSPNYTGGRSAKIDRIIIHWMAGTLAATDAVFQDSKRKTSAHYGIEDNNIHQYVNEGDTAWHAGVSSMNSRSIGIEHSAAPGREATTSTIDNSAALVARIAKEYGIPLDRQHVIKHSEVPYATQCSGTIPIDEIVSKAIKINQGDEVRTFTEDNRRDTNTGLFLKDLGYFKEAVGKEYGDAMYWIFGSSQFKGEQFINSGDVKNINDIVKKDAKSQQGKLWKDFWYSYIAPNYPKSSDEYIKVTDLYIKKEK